MKWRYVFFLLSLIAAYPFLFSVLQRVSQPYTPEPPALVVSVQGQGSLRHKAELAVVDVEVNVRGKAGERVAISQNAMAISKQLREFFTLHSAPMNENTTNATSKYSIDHWFVEDHRTRSFEDYRDDSTTHFESQTRFKVQVSDFPFLTQLANELEKHENAQLVNFDWRLSAATAKILATKSRGLALQDAKEKAWQMAYYGAEIPPDYMWLMLVEDEESSGEVFGSRVPNRMSESLVSAVVSDGGSYDEFSFEPKWLDVEQRVSTKFKSVRK